MGFLSRLFGLSSAPNSPELPPFDHAVFGRLSWDREAGWWVGSFRSPTEGACTVYVSPASDTVYTPSDAQAALFQGLIQKMESIKEEAVREFLPEFNRDWMEGDSIAHEDFVAMLTPESIHIDSDGAMAIALANKNEDADDILGGHVVRIVISPDGRRDVGLEG